MTAPAELDIRLVDFANITDVCDYASLLCQYAGQENMLTSATGAANVRAFAKTWLQETESHFKVLSPAYAVKAIAFYDILSRIGYSKPADRSKINRHILTGLDALIHGDKSVDPYHLFQMIDAGLRCRDKVYHDNALVWHSATLGRWYRQMSDDNGKESLSAYDRIHRVNLLMSSGLWAYETGNEARFKQHLFETHRHYLTDISGHDLPTLRATDQFLHSSLQYLSEKDRNRSRDLISDAIVTHPSASPFLRAAITLRTAI